ncbi:MAG: hypothetical protein ACYS26_19960 [Planctomycetota bacterium]|jgi:hypothetical protein
MNDPWPEPTDEELPDDTLPGGPEDDEPDRDALVPDALEGCGLLFGPAGCELMFHQAAGAAGDEIDWVAPGESVAETVDVKIRAGGNVLEAADGRWWRVDYDADRAGGTNPGRWKVSAKHGVAILQFFDGEFVKRLVMTD